VTPFTERIVQFGTGAGRIGVVTEPVGTARIGILLILGAGILHRVGPSRAAVQVARHLAAQGIQSLRFDHAGIGDSDRGTEQLRESVMQDVRDGVDILLRDVPSASGHVTVLGFCAGADTALVCAGLDPRIHSIALFDALVPRTVGHFFRAFGHRWSRATVRGMVTRVLRSLRRSPAAIRVAPPDYFGLVAANRREFCDIVRTLNDRRVRRLWLMTSGVLEYCSDPRQISEVLGNVASERLDQLEWNPAADHVLSTRGQVDWLCHTLAYWMSDADCTPHSLATARGLGARSAARGPRC